MNDVCNLRDFFDYLNSHLNYLILRNWDNIFDEKIYGSGHEDIDILCDDIDEFVRLTNSIRIHSEPYRDNYNVCIGHTKIRLDIRHIGDGYYPRQWERRMLQNRVLTESNIYIMDKEDYFYSLIYHALLQKSVCSLEYFEKISKMQCDFMSASNRVDNEEGYLRILKAFLNRNVYVVETPADPGVFLNWHNINLGGMKFKFNAHLYLRRVIFRIKKVWGYYTRRIMDICNKFPLF
jgi:hypothetical protein